MKIILSLFIILSGFTSLAQNVIELKNKQTGKTRILKSGTKLYFKSTSDSSFIKGKIVQIKDTSVVIFCPDYDEEDPLVDLKFNEIVSIKKATKLHSVSRTIGSVMAPAGALLFINGIVTLSRDNEFQGKKTYNEEETKALTILGGGFLVAGAIPYFIKPKVYDLKNVWTISMKHINKKNKNSL